MKILLQVPAGLKRKVIELADKIKGEVFISCEPCFGACDLRDKEAQALGCSKIVHYGHNKLIESKIPVEYREMREKINPIPILEKEFEKIQGYNSFGLVSSLQFLDCLQDVKGFLESKGKKAQIGEGKLYPGQILGCELSAALSNVECYLFVGSGLFHPLGLSLKTEKPVLFINIEKGRIEDLKEIREKFLRQKFAAIGLAKGARSFGILISTKPGQLNLELAEKIKTEIEKKGKKAYFLVLDEIVSEKLPDLDCYINTACPRIAIEDRALFNKPILNPDELDI